jgi:hypothetical protein
MLAISTPTLYPWRPLPLMRLPGAAHQGAFLYAEQKEGRIPDFVFRRLAGGVLAQAVLDVRAGGERGRDARLWLLRSGLDWCETLNLGVQPAKFQAWVNAGCPSGGYRPTGQKRNR